MTNTMSQKRLNSNLIYKQIIYILHIIYNLQTINSFINS